ncbi:MAG: ribosome-associated translation inhibitor RaiA [Actinobacteria bacterium]|nr:ribosome-associated translation inhibitor RaiA [Actinomycetota bacterium]
MGYSGVPDTTEVVVHGRHVDLSSRFREHVTEKLERVGKFGVPIARVDVEVSKETNPRLADRAFEVELTCRSRGPVIRAEAYSTDHYSAFDIAFGRLTERLRRYADRHRPHRGGRHSHRGSLSNAPWQEIEIAEAPAEPSPEAVVEEVEDTTVFESGPVVVREKTHVAAPMTVEEAVTHMELVGHDFYLFQDSDSGLQSVVYRRRGYDYGLIRIDTSEQADAD